MSTRLPIVKEPSASAAPLHPGAALPTVQALTRLWQTVAQRPLWAPEHFWRFLKLCRQLRLQRYTAANVPHRGPLAQVNDCHSCTDICCVGPQALVLLRLKDIAMLHDLQRTDLMTHTKPTFAAAQLRARPALQRQVHSRAWQIYPVLRQNSMRACVALTSAGKCSLYPHWPMACARFPYAFDRHEPATFYSPRCQSFWLDRARAPQSAQMAAAAVAAYNERVQDAILLAYAPQALQALGLTTYLRLHQKL